MTSSISNRLNLYWFSIAKSDLLPKEIVGDRNKMIKRLENNLFNVLSSSC